jgi:hypothetical protein
MALSLIKKIMAKREPVPADKHAADNKRSLVTPVLQITCACWLIAKMISWKLWISERLFPLVPPVDFLKAPSIAHLFLLIASLLLFVILIIQPQRKIFLSCLLVAELLSCLLDQNRWQPWEYQYLFILTICLVNKNNGQKIIAGIAFLLAAIYVYSGLWKFNPGFLDVVWEKMILMRFFKMNPALAHQQHVYYGGYLLAATELFAGVGLLFAKTQKKAACILFAMHCFILLLLGPLGLRYNIVVWPWNILMMALLWLVFIDDGNLSADRKLLWKGWNKAVIICWGILPLLNLAGLWDNYPSSKLYSGGLPQMVFCLSDSSEIKKLKPYLNKKDTYHICNEGTIVNIQTWGMKELNIPPYPELRVYKKIQQQWESSHQGTSTKTVFYYVGGENKIKIIDVKN